MPRRARSQPGRTRCHWGDGRAVPCAVRVGGAAGGAGRALGAVPAGARPVPRRRGALPRQGRARAGRRSVGAPQCSAVTRRHRRCPAVCSSRMTEWLCLSLRPSLPLAKATRRGARSRGCRAAAAARPSSAAPWRSASPPQADLLAPPFCPQPRPQHYHGGTTCHAARPHWDPPSPFPSRPPSLPVPWQAHASRCALAGGGARGAAGRRSCGER